MIFEKPTSATQIQQPVFIFELTVFSIVDVTSVAASEFTPAAQKQSSRLSVSSTPVSEYDNHNPARQENINSVTAKSGLWWTLCQF